MNTAESSKNVEALSNAKKIKGTHASRMYLAFICNHLPTGTVHLHLCAHLLDLRGLFFKLGGEKLHPFLLLGDR